MDSIQKIRMGIEQKHKEADRLYESGKIDQAYGKRCEARGMKAALELAECEMKGLLDIIQRASLQFFHDGSDGETAAKMLAVLNEADAPKPVD